MARCMNKCIADYSCNRIYESFVNLDGSKKRVALYISGENDKIVATLFRANLIYLIWNV